MAAVLIFLFTYFVLAVGRIPGLHIDRTGASIVGAALMVAAGALSLQAAYQAIDLDTIVLLFGMMIVVANLQISGFFGIIAERVIVHAHRPVALLAAIVITSGAFSAFFVNDTICLVLTPVVLEVAAALRRNPVPYLLAIAMSANAGSVATITGNPQNMIIGSLSGIPYRTFAAELAPVAAISLLLTALAIWLFYRAEFRYSGKVEVPPPPVHVDRPLMWKSLAVSAAMIAAFFAGWPVPEAAIVAGALLLITRRVRPERVYHRIDWPLLVLFAGLFIVVAGFETTTAEHTLAGFASRLGLDNTFILSGFSAVLSNIVSNVPAVLAFKPLLEHVHHPDRAWIALAMSSTLAGNLTIPGSVANLIVVQQARREVHIGFWEYARVGAPLAVITILIGAAWLAR